MASMESVVSTSLSRRSPYALVMNKWPTLFSDSFAVLAPRDESMDVCRLNEGLPKR